MNTVSKSKDKTSTPRILPRPTAASAARAARNATNRNVTVFGNKQSPNRTSPSPPPGKYNRNHTQKIDSTSDLKAQPCTSDEKEFATPQYNNIPVSEPNNQDADTFLITDSESVVEKINEVECCSSNDTQVLSDPIIEFTQSRPQTPLTSSRPVTPKSVQSSRPQTPRMPSRPTTPVHTTQRNSTPASRPNTPQRPTTPVRPKTPTKPAAVVNKAKLNNTVPAVPNADVNEEDVKSAFLAKQKLFQRMKRDLDLKQQAILEVFDCLRGLHERMSREGVSGAGEGLQEQDLIVFNVGDWTAQEITQLYRDAVISKAPENALEIINDIVPVDADALSELDVMIVNVADCFANLCHRAFTERQEIIDWAKNLIETQEEIDKDTLDHIARYNNQGFDLCNALRGLKSRADEAVGTITELSKRACDERSALIAVGESLVREVARLRQDLEASNAVIIELRELQSKSIVITATTTVEEVRRELEEEKAAKLSLKEKLTLTESQLRQTRSRVTKMDKQLREAEASISSLTGTVKMLEDQSRQKEVHLEARARKLRESLKTGEVTASQLSQQRDTLQNEVQELKQHIEMLKSEHKFAIQSMENELQETKRTIEEQFQMIENETKSREAAEAALVDSGKCIEELKMKIDELEKNIPNPDLPTEREMDLWAELQATKDVLHKTEDEISACKREKVRFLETLTKIAESENKVGIQQKLAAELLSKEEIVGKLQTQIRDLTKNIKLKEQKVIQYEEYVRSLQAHNRAVANCQEAPDGISYQDLQQEIMNLKMSILDAAHRNEELSELLAQKDQQLEQQDKTSRAQARVIKVNKQIAAKADEIQELFATLENKQQQIHRLEKIVLALEEQQRRAQAQRTRQEEKIAALEHELAAGINRKERKFLFF